VSRKRRNRAGTAKAVNGDTVNVDLTTTEAVKDVRMTIEGRAAPVTALDDSHYRAAVVLPDDVAYGRAARFTVGYSTEQGQFGSTVFATTDGSAVQLWNTHVEVVPIQQAWVDASTGRGSWTPAPNWWRVFDGDLTTATDTTTATRWVTVDSSTSSEDDVPAPVRQAGAGTLRRVFPLPRHAVRTNYYTTS
jgi:hypothetical protein